MMITRALAHTARRVVTAATVAAPRARHIHRAPVLLDKVTITFKQGDDELRVQADEGQTLLDVAMDNNVDIEGACGGELACSTCHVIFPKEIYDQLPPKQEEEEDMLDLAWGLTDTSRLCCQIKVTKLLEGVVIEVPEESNNMM